MQLYSATVALPLKYTNFFLIVKGIKAKNNDF